MGLVYKVVCFCASLRESKGLSMDPYLLKRYMIEEDFQYITPHHDVTPHIAILLCGQLKGECGERCHFLPLDKTKKLGFNIQQVITLLMAV